jgi:hypothetical protein
MTTQELNQKLIAPLPAHEVEWRMAQTGIKKDGTPWGKVLCYLTNRAVMNRLDSVFGPLGWRNEYQLHQINHADKHITVCLCGISVEVAPDRWVTKWDGAEPTDIETGKGALSDSMKRAAVQWGIGRYLYDLGESWATFTPDGLHNAKIEGSWHRWSPPALPEWAIPSAQAQQEEAPQQPAAAPQKAAAPKPTPAPAPAPKPAPNQTERTPQGQWRDYPVPKFIKKYAGGTLGDMQDKDILWWAANYQPKPFKGKISSEDVKFRSMLTVAQQDIEAGSQQDDLPGGDGQEPDDGGHPYGE